MGRIVITEFVSLDGVIEDPGGVEGFKLGGWVVEINRGEGGDKFKLAETLETEALLLGRRTYDTFAASWTSRSGEFADRFNGLPKYVVSSTLEDPDWNNSTVLKGDVVEEVSKLKRALDGEIVVHGSPQLARTLIEHDLVDELRLMVYPVVLGAGDRLFGETSAKKPLRLVDTQTSGGRRGHPHLRAGSTRRAGVGRRQPSGQASGRPQQGRYPGERRVGQIREESSAAWLELRRASSSSTRAPYRRGRRGRPRGSPRHGPPATPSHDHAGFAGHDPTDEGGRLQESEGGHRRGYGTARHVGDQGAQTRVFPWREAEAIRGTLTAHHIKPVRF
jgi:dihydrofolate reductase